MYGSEYKKVIWEVAMFLTNDNNKCSKPQFLEKEN